MSSFDNNYAWGRGGDIEVSNSLYKNMKSFISNCIFRENSANRYGGAVSTFGMKLHVNGSLFYDSTAPDIGGEASALYLYHIYFCSIINSAFKRNKADLRGGTIEAIASKRLIRNSTFLFSSYSQDRRYSGEEFLYSMSEITLVQSLWIKATVRINDTSLTLRQGTSGNVLVKNGLRINCLPGKNIKVFNQSFVNESFRLFRFSGVSCSFCQRNFCSLSAGHLYFQNKSIDKTQNICYYNPVGAVCEKGKMKGPSNFWGYISGKQVLFAICPFRYCCVNKECKNYFSCHKGRTGNLCGRCRKGLAENF